jgi:hypothetical protein
MSEGIVLAKVVAGRETEHEFGRLLMGFSACRIAFG